MFIDLSFVPFLASAVTATSNNLLSASTTASINFGDIAQAVGTIIAAVIAAIALAKTNRYNISDKVARGQWAFETYVIFAGVRIRSSSPEDNKKYTSFYYLFYAYADQEAKKRIREIDQHIQAGEKDISQAKLFELLDWYYDTYRLNRFSMKKMIGKNEQLKMFDLLEKSEIDSEDIKG